MKKNSLAIGIIFLFVASAFTPLTFGINNESTEQSTYEIDPLHDYYGCYSLEEIPESIRPVISEEVSNDNLETKNVVTTEDKTEILYGPPLDSAWPMKCHDTRHTGRSPYSTVDTWYEIWRYDTWGRASCGPAIDKEGIIYIGAYDLTAVYPNGTEKWTFDTDGYYSAVTPAIDENGIIYIGSQSESYLYAINPNGTRKWRYPAKYDVMSSAAIGDDGTIYFSCGGGYPVAGRITALYPNRTLKWEYKTNHVVYSSPAIGNDGTIYCGCHDEYLYALYPNNGTLKWRYKTGHWIRTSPCIGDDGTIYVVSLDNRLHAVNPDGTLKWKTNMGQGGTSPTIGQDGTIYAGYEDLHAINPTNGSIKWKFNVGGTMRGGTPCNSVNGTIYVATSDGGKLIAINPDGTEKWRESIGTCESAPAIDENGFVYVGSNSRDCLYAFGIGDMDADAFGPYFGLIDQPVQFRGSPRGGISPISYHWTFGDGETSDEQNPTYAYTNVGNYTVVLTVTDDIGDTSIDTTWTWIQVTNNPPTPATVKGAIIVLPFIPYKYKFKGDDPDGTPIWYIIDWGQWEYSGWLGPYEPGVEITVTRTWELLGRHEIRAIVKDGYGAQTGWSNVAVDIPRDIESYNYLFLRFLEQFPLLERLLILLIK